MQGSSLIIGMLHTESKQFTELLTCAWCWLIPRFSCSVSWSSDHADFIDLISLGHNAYPLMDSLVFMSYDEKYMFPDLCYIWRLNLHPSTRSHHGWYKFTAILIYTSIPFITLNNCCQTSFYFCRAWLLRGWKVWSSNRKPCSCCEGWYKGNGLHLQILQPLALNIAYSDQEGLIN